MENNFLLIKERAIEMLKDKDACNGQMSRVMQSDTEDDLLEVIKDNLDWVSSRFGNPVEFLSLFTPEKISLYGILNTGEENTGLANTGDRNTGYSNTGDSNTGDRNTGDSNTGDRNTGDSNTGDRNTGYRNTGDSNTGDRNTGDSNTGDRNTGDSNTGYSNTGYRNTGDWNTGDRNTGYSNTGDRNTGAFCTGQAPFPIFNQPSDWTEDQFKNSKAYELLCQVDTKQWVPSSHMSEEEKAKYPSHAIAEGYLKDIPFKESFQNAWHNWSTSSHQAFIELPNFNAEIFFEITGVKIA